ncbi:MAG: TonB-dependent receptor plug domain-containing protein, partial [Verrucomicrobia bacterium]|nr:TonB-dependent receptor plug domain-containing protein [Verrucomicrobiota bacterium]
MKLSCSNIRLGTRIRLNTLKLCASLCKCAEKSMLLFCFVACAHCLSASEVANANGFLTASSEVEASSEADGLDPEANILPKVHATADSRTSPDASNTPELKQAGLDNTEENPRPIDAVGEPGQISGIIIDQESGKPLRGVAVLVADTEMGTITDIEGRYVMPDLPSGEYTLTFIKTGFIETNVTGNKIIAGEETQLDFAIPPRPIEMSDDVYELQDFTVTAEYAANQNLALLMLRQQSVASLEALSSEDFAKFAASDAAEAIAKISGASLSDGKYVVMRGLNDRYNTTLVNGVRLPSPDPDRKAVAMDIFPTSLFESIVARKTYTADMPGESSGGSIELRTKGAPEEPFVKFSTSFGQQMTSGQTNQFLADPEQLSYGDWLKGKQDGRGYALVPGTKNFTSNYPTQVGGADFPRMAPNVSVFPKWGDRSYSLSLGNSWRVNDWFSVGAIFGLKTGEKQRTSFREVFKKEINDSKLIVKEIGLKEYGGGVTASEEEYSLSALGSLGFQIGDHSSLNYTYLLAKSLSSKATIADYRKFGEVSLFETSTPDNAYHDARDIELLVEDRLLEAHQFSGEHLLEFLLPNEWTFSWYHTDALMSQEEPDIRNVAEFYPLQESFSRDPGLEPLSRYQRMTEQESKMSGLSLAQEFSISDKASISVKLGYASESSIREFEQLEMLNVDASYITDPYWGAMPYPEATGLTNISEPDRYQTTVGGM